MRNYKVGDEVALRTNDGVIWVGTVIAFLPHPRFPNVDLALVDLPAGAHMPVMYGDGLAEYSVKVRIGMGAWMEGDLVRWERD
jgi:hypothetical protein